MNRTQVVFGVAVILVLLGSAAWQLSRRTAVAPLPSETVLEESAVVEKPTPAAVPLEVTAVTVAPATTRPVQASFTIAQGDTITSWSFKGAYTGTPELVTKAQSEINRLSGELVTATSSKMILYVSIANQYELLGDGQKQYDSLKGAIQANPENALPWHNMGVLMERLGALQSARVAYEQATLLHSESPVYHYAYLQFLISHMRGNTAAIEKAFAAAEQNLGKKQYLADLREEWQTP